MKPVKGYTSMIKNVNESIIRSHLLGKKQFTKKELAQLTGLSFPTVNRIIDEWVTSMEIIEIGLIDSTGGRRAKSYVLNGEYAYTLCIYLSENSLTYEICNVFGEQVLQDQLTKTAQSYVETIDELVGEMLVLYPFIRAIAIGVPGSVCGGVIKYIDTYTELQNFPLKRYMEEKWNQPVAVENDMKAIVLGCYRFASMEEESLACIYLGHNGPGCGIIVNGQVVRGQTEFAGEVGFLPLYDAKNLQTLALQGLDGVDLGDYFARLITVINVMINPKMIVLYDHPLLPTISELEIVCKKYLPENELPKLMWSDQYRKDYMSGLHDLAHHLIYPLYSIQSGQV